MTESEPPGEAQDPGVPLPGGQDRGAELVEGTVRRQVGSWTPAVTLLLRHLADVGFAGAPRDLGRDARGRHVVSYLEGSTVGGRRPWPTWVHSERALVEVAHWLRDYHRAAFTFVPPLDSVWREGGRWRPGLIVGHRDAAPYNAVWRSDRLVGFVDWDTAGPIAAEDDLAWVAFSWVPLHARSVVGREGFHAFGERRRRLETFLTAYGWTGRLGDMVELVRARVADQVDLLRDRAEAGDPTYRRMLELGRDLDLERAIAELADFETED